MDKLQHRNIARGVSNYWIGLSDVKNEGDFVWGDSGAKISKEVESYWKEGEPNNRGDFWGHSYDHNGEEDCVEVAAGKMNDRNCGAKLKFVCQYKIH